MNRNDVTSRIRVAYSRWIRPLFPAVRPGTHAGIATAHRSKRVIDYLLPVVDVDDDWEGGIVRAHQELTRAGESVLMVGGGWGISLVAAKRAVGEGGSVTVYEASRSQMATLEETARLNGLTGYVVKNCRVGTGSEIWDPEGKEPDESARLVEPESLPETDVLELDCEGAELSILRGLSIRPRAIIVEVHPDKTETSADRIFPLLDDMGYEVVFTSGHDGTSISLEEARLLVRPGGPRSLAGGGRAPVILGAIRRSCRAPGQ